MVLGLLVYWCLGFADAYADVVTPGLVDHEFNVHLSVRTG